jgi:glutamate synthase (NADPH/NADH) small chain
MARPTGFLEVKRAKQPYRPVAVRVTDFAQVQAPWPQGMLHQQAARCMDCGIPFCHQGCPLGNLIPDWNDLVYRGMWADAMERLHATNNFPEFTGTLCPAPCEGACVLGINDEPVTIKAVELTIVDHAWEAGLIKPLPPAVLTGKKVAIVGSGPAGLAAAQQLRRVGHEVTVFERDDRIGGLLRYGIPEFKMEKRVLDRRLQQMVAEGVEFRPGSHVGAGLPVAGLRAEFAAILLTGGACAPRDIPLPGRGLQGIHFAMEYLTQQSRVCAGDPVPESARLSAKGKRVVILGGGDTGADCLGTAHRQGAASVHQLEILPKPPQGRAEDNPWPEWPRTYRVASAHEEGGERLFAIATQRFVDNGQGRVAALDLVKLAPGSAGAGLVEVPGSGFTLAADLVLLAAGFVGPERPGLLADLGVRLTERGTVWRDGNWQTSAQGVFTAGDMQHGQSLIVIAIAEGRAAARGVDLFLMGESSLPAPVC